MTTAYQGLFAALTTPFKDEALSPDMFKQNILKYNRFDLAGYVVGGSTGENIHLSDEECLTLVKTAAETAPPGRKIIAGTARGSARLTIAFTNRAADLGADAALILLPHYYKGLMASEALRRFYETVADHSRIPVIIYSIPQNTGIIPPPGLIVELSCHPNILGIKDSSGNLSLLEEAFPQMAEGSTFLLGAGSILFPGLLMGASGGILTLAAVAPELCVQLYDCFRNQAWEEGRRRQMDLVPLNQAITKHHGVPGAKFALDLRGYYGGPCRLPLLPPGDDAQKEIRKILEDLHLIGH
jgi:4-hydroxy-2-oxoglutarate aldolase